jgi:hypothetical protein
MRLRDCASTAMRISTLPGAGSFLMGVLARGKA